jgi:hypothetical protein
MDRLDDVLKAIAANPKRGIFVSPSGAEKQRELAVWIAERLEAKGYIPILQDLHFKRTDFMLAMDAVLTAGVRVLALMSREYLTSMKEATVALDDPRNSNGRLILSRSATASRWGSCAISTGSISRLRGAGGPERDGAR